MQPTPSDQLAAWVVAAVILVVIATVSLLPAGVDSRFSGVVDAGVRSPAVALCLLGQESDEDVDAAAWGPLALEAAPAAVLPKRC